MPDLTIPNSQPYSQPGFGLVTTLIAPFFTGSSYPVTNSLGAQIVYATTGSIATSSLNVTDYNNHSVQFFVSSSGNATSSMTLQSTVDGITWISETSFLATSVSSSVSRFTGRRKYFQSAVSSSGNVTASVYIISGE